MTFVSPPGTDGGETVLINQSQDYADLKTQIPTDTRGSCRVVGITTRSA